VAAADQKKSIDAISESLEKVSGIAGDTSSSSTQSADSAKHLLSKTQELISIATNLASMSEKLQQTVGRFNVEGELYGKKRPSRMEAGVPKGTGRSLGGTQGFKGKPRM
jgi:hypothetical protein